MAMSNNNNSTNSNGNSNAASQALVQFVNENANTSTEATRCRGRPATNSQPSQAIERKKKTYIKSYPISKILRTDMYHCVQLLPLT